MARTPGRPSGKPATRPASSADSPLAFTNRLSTLIGSIYEISTDAHRLQGVLDELTWMCGADNGGLSIVDMATGESQVFMFTPLGVFDDDEVMGMFKALEPWRRTVQRLEAGRVYIDDEGGLFHELTNSPGYRRWLKLTGNRSRCSAFLRLDDDMAAFLGFARNKNRSRFTREAVRPLEAAMPHLVRAIGINRTINELTVMHDVAEQRYGTLGVGVLLLSDKRRVLFTSQAARRIVSLDLGLGIHDGRLQCADAGEQAVLDELVAAQGRLSGRPGYIAGASMTLGKRSNGPAPLSLMVAPYRNRLEVRSLASSGGRVLVLLFDPSFRAPTQEQALQQIYGLSVPEAELAAALAAGKRLADLAEETGTSRETLRSRLRRIFTKTGTRRQSELLRVLMASPALLEHRPSVKMT